MAPSTTEPSIAGRLIDAFPGFVGLYTPDGTFLVANGRGLGSQDVPLSGLVNTKIWDLPHWSSSAELQAKTRDAMQRAARGERVRFDARVPTKTGFVECEVTFSPIVDSTGAVTHVATFGVDISARNRAVEALFASERRYRELVEHAADGIFVADADGRYLDANARGCEMLGYTLEELTGLRIRDVLAPGETVYVMTEFPERIRLDRVLRRKDGTMFPVDLVGVRLPGGTYLAIARDVTERKTAEEALRQREAELVAMCDATVEALFVHQDGIIVATNKAARELYRLPPDGAVGQPIVDYVAPESRALIAHHMAAGTAEPYEAMGRRADGTTFPASVQARTIMFRGNPARLAALRDLTEERRIQASLAFADRMASVGTLAAGVAHEINNPLTFITVGLEGVLRTLQAGPPEPGAVAEMIETLRDAQEGAGRIAAIVRDLKTFSRADEDSTGPAHLGPVIQYAARMAAAEIRLRAKLVVNLQETPPVLGSETRLSQVFLNLLVNAAQAIPPGAADRNTITVSAHAEGDRVIVSVADTGAGIEPMVLERIFDPFVTTKSQGTGLGLSICHGIVARLGGSIDVDSVVGGGTTFRVTLPVARATALQEVSPPEVTLRAPLRRPRVLAVDDEPVILKLTVRILEDEYDVVAARSATEALAVLERGESFDAILCDMLMPETTGIDLFQRLSERWPELARRVVFLTGGVFTRQAAAALASSGRPQVDKPFRAADLKRTILGVIDAR